MPVWTVEDTLEVDLDDVYDVRVRIVCGELVVTTGPGPARLEVKVLSGDPVEVVHELEALRIFHRDTSPQGVWRLIDGWSSGHRPEALVTLRVPPGTQADLTTVAAPIVVTGLEDRLGVNTVSGDVTLKDVAGDVDAKTVSGELDVLGLRGALKAKTVSGTVTVANGATPRVDAKTVSGDVSLDLALDTAGAYDVTTVSGAVGLLIPPEPRVTVDATSMSGRLVTDFGLEWERRPGHRRLRETIGGGGARLTVRTLSGEIRLLERRAAA